MNERILKALMQLFAIIAAINKQQSDSSNEIVKSYLNHELPHNLVSEYMKLFISLKTQMSARIASHSHKLKVTALFCTKILVICDAINKELVQRQKIIILVRLLEFINNEKFEKIPYQQLDYVALVAHSLKIPKEEFNIIKDFVFLKSTQIVPDSDKILIVDGDFGFQHEHINHIYSENLSGQIIFLKAPTPDMYFFVIIDENEISMNNTLLNPDRVHVMTLGASLRGTKLKKPIYLGDITNAYNLSKLKSKIVFEVEKLEYKFPNGVVGLHSMNFIEKSGKLVGIMGSSGAGKTTLLNVLSGIEKPSEGHVWVNGVDLHNNNGELNGLIGYVSQDDLLMEELTVFQNLYYSACQCLSNLTKPQLYRTVLKLLKSLGLYEIRNMKVGNPLNKRISGGQRKRLNIALELIREPPILFLDEPTSGLSSRDSANILDLLRELTIKGKLIFLVIHQPSSEIFKMLDTLIILDTGGYLVYKGDPVESITYFKTKIRQANWNDSECPTCGNVNSEQIFNILEEQVIDEYGNVMQQRRTKPEEWHDYYIKEVSREKKRSVLVKRLPIIGFKIPKKFVQFLIFLKRDALSKISNMQYILINLLETPLIALLLTYIIRYRSISADALGEYTLLHNSNLPVYLFMSVIIGLFVGITVSSQEIIKDRAIRKREHFLNLSTGAYLSSKMAILLIISAYQALIYVLIGNTMLGIQGMYFKYWLMLFAVWINANVMGLTISSAFNTTGTIYILIPFLIIPQIILTGVLVSFDKLNPSITNQGVVPFYGDWFVARWAYEGLAVEQYMNNEFEKPIYKFDKQKQTSIMKRDFWIATLDNKTNHLERAINNENIYEAKDDILTLQNELTHEIESNTDIKPDFSIDNITCEKITSSEISMIRSYLSALKSYYNRLYISASKAKDQFVDSMQATPEMKEKYIKLKRNNFNESLESFVTNSNELERIVEYNNRIYQKAYPIFTDPDNVMLRAHFYAPRKRLAIWYIDTYWLNLAMIWLISVILYVLLYYKVLLKIVNKIGQIVDEYLRQREKRLISRGTDDIRKSTHHKAFSNLSIWR